MQKLARYFTEGIENRPLGNSIGVEVETSFVRMENMPRGSGYWYVPEHPKPITIEQSQELFKKFLEKNFWWKVAKRRGGLIVEISDDEGNKLLYELGRQNIEISAAPKSLSKVIDNVKNLESKLLEFTSGFGRLDSLHIIPNNGPIVVTDENLLVIPDERDAVWLELDGRPALELLARISAVQFTISVPVWGAIECLNRLGENIGLFLRDYPQEEYWRRYIKDSKANYHPMRYGGPLFFDSIEDYCQKLIKHDVVVGPKLVPYDKVQDIDIPLYLRSIWWYFRLRRYGNTLCIEVRPFARDRKSFQEKLDLVMSILPRM
jgi:hypothetical protein